MAKGTFEILRRIGSARRDQRGTALVELALSLSVMILIMFGIVEFGRVIYTAIEVSNAAHAGVQYGASSRAASADTTGIANAAMADAANVSGLSVTSVNTSCTCANTAYTPTSCSDNTTCRSNGTALVETITVNTQATYAPLFQYPRQGTFTLKGSASQVVSNQ